MPGRKPKVTLSQHHLQRASDLRSYLRGYFWWIAKNVVGWILILIAWPVGIALPGPGGIPLFLVGFALVAFPGKRRLTSRVMRGKPFDLEARLFTFLATAVSVLVTAGLLWFLIDRYRRLLDEWDIEPVAIVGVALLALVVTFAVTRLALHGVNLFIRTLPIARRVIRPWLRRRGIHLLPTRRKRVHLEDGTVVVENEEILEFDTRHRERVNRAWDFLKPWLKRLLAIGITVAIFYYMLRPLYVEWDSLRPRIREMHVGRLLSGTMMFAFFLFFFRSLSWRAILSALGHRLPVASSTRIWSTSELARYLPGVVWQVVGRVWLVKPYGVRGSVCTTSQVLELILFLLANVLVAVTCLLFFGYKRVDEAARGWLATCMALVPVLTIVIHPRVFHSLSARVLGLFGKPPLERLLSMRLMYGLLLLAVAGLLWQGMALWLTVGSPLGLIIDKWWLIAGAYCLAWIAGFLAVWAPGGLGVRELVFMLAIHVALPQPIRDSFASLDEQRAFLAFLAVLLRLWATVGELIVATLAYAFDWRGAIGDPSARGRLSANVAQSQGS